MSRTEEVNKMTENVYKVWFWIRWTCDRILLYLSVMYDLQGILDQFNPSLKNFVAMGKHYEKALTGQPEVPHRSTGERKKSL